MTTCTEAIDFGPGIGIKEIVQYAGGAFHNACLQANSKVDDSTGLRLHSGAHVAIRFLIKNPQLISNQHICEVGCGTGVYGLIGTRGGSISSHLTLTDGNTETVNLANKNVQLLASISMESRITCKQLLWGSKDAVNELFQYHKAPRETPEKSSPSSQGSVYHDEVNPNIMGKTHFFDVVLGCELFYYRTNIEELIFTVMELTNSTGIFVHSHVFRRVGQDVELINTLHGYNWVTYEIPVEVFVDQVELDEHPEWHNVHCLVSGSFDRMNSLIESDNIAYLCVDKAHEGCTKSKWKLFTGSATDRAEASVPIKEHEDMLVGCDNGFLIDNLFSNR